MSKYNFEEDENDFGETRRLDSINEEVKKYEKNHEKEEAEYLKHFQTEQILPSQPSQKEYQQQQQPQPKIKRRPDEFYYNEKEKVKNSNSKKYTQTVQKPPYQAQKKENSYKFLLLIFLGIFIFMVVFLLVFLSVGGKSTKNVTTPPVVENNKQPTQDITQVPKEEEEEKQLQQELVLIKEVNSNKELIVYDIANNKTETVKTDKTTEIFDKNGKKINLSEISEGDIVKVSLDDKNELVVQIDYTNDMWTQEQVSGVKIQSNGKTVTIANKVYYYTDETIFSYKNKVISPQKINEMDVLSLKGMNNKVWFVDVLEYHGYIAIKNKDKIKDGTIQINNEKEIYLSDIEKITVSEGAHNIVIKGSNIEPYTADIFIVADEEFSIDLSDAQAKTSVLILKTNVENYQLYMNGTSVNYSEPLVLTQGEYSLKITKDGYLPWEQKVNLTEPSMEVTANLTEEIKKGNLVISTEPTAAYVYVDNQYIGVSPIMINLEYGEHRFLVKMDGYQDISSPITIDKEEETIMVDLVADENFSGQP